jgi:DNA replication initiation complex subunit (GINS family)
MSIAITSETIFSKLQTEKITGELMPLQKDFYTQVVTFVNELGKENSEEKNRQAENAKKMIAILRERRKQKLLVYLAYDKQLPQPIPNEEEVLYNEITKILNKEIPNVKLSRLKITADIPEVITTEGRKIGPYRQGEVIEVSSVGDADFIVKNKIGETITQ